MRDIKKIIIHHSDSSFGDFKVIDEWHKERGFCSPTGVHCGYHKIILNGVRVYGHEYNPANDGLIENGRPIEEQGAHTSGQNRDSIGICLIGKEKFTPKQFDVLELLIKELHIDYPAISEVCGHEKYNNTSCPMFDWKTFLKKRGL